MNAENRSTRRALTVTIGALSWRSWSMSFSTLMTTRCAWRTGWRATCVGERISTTCAVCSVWGVRRWPAPAPATAHARHPGARMCSGGSGVPPGMRSRSHDARLHVSAGHADRAACAQRACVLARDAPAAGHPRSCQRWDRVRSANDRTVGAALAGTRLLAGRLRAMHPMPISHEPHDPTRRSLGSRALPLVPAAGTGAAVAEAGRSQRVLVQWSLLLCPDRKKRRAL